MKNQIHICPHCDKELPPETVEAISTEALFEFRSSVGKVKTPKKTAASRRNIQKARDISPEKRQAAINKIPPEVRTERARKAATARWNKKKQSPE